MGEARCLEHWLGGERWRILKIATNGLTVMNLCGDEEVLTVSDAAPVSPRAGITVPAHSIEADGSDFGPGTVELSGERCCALPTTEPGHPSDEVLP